MLPSDGFICLRTRVSYSSLSSLALSPKRSFYCEFIGIPCKSMQFYVRLWYCLFEGLLSRESRESKIRDMVYHVTRLI